MDELNKKVVIISGGAGLLGKEYVKAVVQNGGIGIIADINEKIGMETLNEVKLEYPGGVVDYLIIDITSEESIKKVINHVNSKYGKIDALVNSAYPRNKNWGNKFESVTYSDFCENVNLHLGGYFLTSQQFAIFFKKQGFGTIINMASIYGVIAPRFEIYDNTSMTMPVEYAAIKAAVIHLTKYIAKYLKGSNVNVNCISPGGIFDSQSEEFLKGYYSYCMSKGMLDKKDLTGTLIFLLSDAAKYITGQNFIVDDGFCL